MKHLTYINAKWIESKSNNWIDVYDPAKQTVFAQVPALTEIECKQAILDSHIAWQSWKSTSPSEKYNYLTAIKNYLLDNKKELGTALSQENGKSLKEAIGEVVYSAQYFEFYAEEAKRIHGCILASPQSQSLQILKQALGVCAAITPWNFPMAMLARKLAPALAAGCTMLAKPDHHTPLSAIALAKACEYAKLPAGVFQLLTALPEVAGPCILNAKEIKKISFTGSTPVGKYLMQESAKTLKKLSLELGGNAPFIVFEDADIDKAVDGAMQSKYRNAGQTCVCTNRFYIHENIYDSFIQKFKQKVENLNIGYGLDADTDIGPLIHKKAKDKILGLLAEAKTKGADVISIGKSVDPNSNYLNPTLVLKASPDSRLHKEEIFGPVSAFYKFKSEQEVIDMANSSEYGLAAYFYSENIARIHRVAKELEFGMIGINSGRVSNAYAPFGGIKESGFGREGSHLGIEEYLYTKLWHQEL